MNIYVSNLSFDVQNDDLQYLFEEFGRVSSARIISDKVTKRSRGFGFVEMPDEEDGAEAIKRLNGKYFKDRVISVNAAKEKEERETRVSAPSPW